MALGNPIKSLADLNLQGNEDCLAEFGRSNLAFGTMLNMGYFDNCSKIRVGGGLNAVYDTRNRDEYEADEAAALSVRLGTADWNDEFQREHEGRGSTMYTTPDISQVWGAGTLPGKFFPPTVESKDSPIGQFKRLKWYESRGGRK